MTLYIIKPFGVGVVYWGERNGQPGWMLNRDDAYSYHGESAHGYARHEFIHLSGEDQRKAFIAYVPARIRAFAIGVNQK